MLTKTSISSAYGLASQLARRNVSLGVLQPSALADLVGTCEMASTESMFDGVDAEDMGAAVPADAMVEQASLAESQPGINDHDLEMQRIVDNASRSVDFVMNLSRNVVGPQIDLVVQKTVAYIDKHRKARSEPLIIKPSYVGSVYQSAALGALLAPYAKAPVDNVEPLRLTAQWPESGYAGAMHSGIADLDESVAAHFKGRDAEVQDLWSQFYGASPGKYRPANMFESMSGMDESLVVFLGAHSLLEGDVVPDGLTMSLSAYRAYLAQVKQQAGGRLAYQYNESKNRLASKQLVVSAPTRLAPGKAPTGTIVVNGEIYAQWLSEGGSPEALYGAVIAGDPLTYDGVLSKADEYTSSWMRVMHLIDTQTKFELHTVSIQGLRLALVELGLSIPEDKMRFSRDDMYEAISERLTHFHVKDVEHLYWTARKAVCRIFYPHLDVEKILNAMENVCRDKAGLDLREAALLVKIDYVTEWVADQLLLNANGE